MIGLGRTTALKTKFSLKVPLFLICVLASFAFAATPAIAEFGIAKFAISARNKDGSQDVSAGSHPYALNTTIVLNEPGATTGNLKDLKLELPPGLVGNPDATPKCSYQEFIRQIKGGAEEGRCPNETVVGLATFYVQSAATREDASASSVAVYNLVPPAGVAAEFGFVGLETTPVLLLESVRSGKDYGVTTTVPDVNTKTDIYASKVTIWGTPGEASHNDWRGTCVRTLAGSATALSERLGLADGEDELEGPLYGLGEEPETGLPESRGECGTGGVRPLLTLPTTCGRRLPVRVAVDSWQEPGDFVGGEGMREREAFLPMLKGCESLAFDPKVSVVPEKSAGSTPSGVNLGVVVPQEGIESPNGLAAADVKDGSVLFPEGLQLNASAVNGLEGCSIAQSGYTGVKELEPGGERGVSTPQFEERVQNPETGRMEADACPGASKVANLRIKTPLLEGELKGAIYLASPQNFMAGAQENPFSSLTAFYGIAEEPRTGVIVKFPGDLLRDPVTGRLTGTIENTPPLPFSELHAEFFGGERASFATPALCGTYQTVASLTPWSTPPGGSSSASGGSSSSPATPNSQFNVTSGPGGSGCSSSPLPFSPAVTTGTTNGNAGGFSSLSTVIDRGDGQQAIHNVTLTYPPGVSAVLTGVPECPEAQANAGTCGAESEIGEDTAEVGLGNDPYTVTGGKIYLTGPTRLEGPNQAVAPFGLSIVTPTKAGPFVLDEGAPVVTRAKIEINPATAAVTVTTGEIPRILDGIPLEVKQVFANINRQGFAINPTSCERMGVSGSVGGWEGASALVSGPFQIGECANLKFAPKFSASVAGKSSKADGAALTTTVEEPAGSLGTQANIAKVNLQIPVGLPARLPTLNKACLAATFAANPASCPEGSVIGTATVKTQILNDPLTGPGYLVSHGNAAFPDVEFVLQGEGVEIVLDGHTDIKKGITYSNFEAVPDAPFTHFEAVLEAGPHSIFTTEHPGQTNLCAKTRTVRIARTSVKRVHGHLRKVRVTVSKQVSAALVIPVKLVAQNGAVLTQNTNVSVTGCPKAKPAKRAKTKIKSKGKKKK